jgi:hypothetical protein
MEWFLFWVGVNSLVGYFVGKPKGVAGECVLLSILFGPIGWIIAMCWSGNSRRCPHCAEKVLLEARVCRFCGRDLPLRSHSSGKHSGPPLLSEKYDLSARRR